MTISIQPAGLASNLYKQSVTLREAVLRKPLGQILSPKELAADSDREHLVAVDGEAVIGSVSLYLETPTMLRIKQMAVSEKARGRGIGAKLITAAEARGRALGASMAMLHARMTAFDFYVAQNYVAVGEEFLENGIPHKRMEKSI